MKNTQYTEWNDSKDRFGATEEEIIKECLALPKEKEANQKPCEAQIKAGISYIKKRFC